MIMNIVNVGTVGHCDHNVSNEHKALYAEIQTLRAKVASAEVLVEALRKIDSLSPSHSDDGWIKEVQLHDGESCGQIVNEFDNEVLIAKITTEALATYDKLIETNTEVGE